MYNLRSEKGKKESRPWLPAGRMKNRKRKVDKGLRPLVRKDGKCDVLSRVGYFSLETEEREGSARPIHKKGKLNVNATDAS